MKRAAVLFISFLVALLSTDVSAQNFPVTEQTLANGLRIIIIEDHKSPLATFQIWYKVGSRNEPEGKKGISHLLEHMMFKGTKKYGPKEFSNIIQRNGGMDNAFTSKDYTVYYQNMSSDRLYLSVELESDRMKNLLLDPKELESERNVVLEERRQRYENDPQALIYEDVISTAFKAHSYRDPVIGWPSTIRAITKEDLSDYYSVFYSPSNAFIVVAGDVEPAKVIGIIKEKFENISAAVKSPVFSTAVEPQQEGPKKIYLRKEAELPYVVMAFHAPSFPHPDSFALDLLSVVLSGGKSARFYQNLVRTQAVALNEFASYNPLYSDPYLFMVGGTASKGVAAETLADALWTEIKKLGSGLISETELQKAKNQIEASFIFAQDSNYSKALYAGMFERLGSWRLSEKYLEGIRKVTAADLQSAAKKYLTEDNSTTGILIPVKEVRK
ncbi:MAG: pitrilysin family protein [Dissulfurispiraceae bacterium]|jgi:zinc protease|nr:pitrilysin family protein [Dissulfurispiraceae bacterium]